MAVAQLPPPSIATLSFLLRIRSETVDFNGGCFTNGFFDYNQLSQGILLNSSSNPKP